MADENIIKRIPPHDTNAERSVIGSMLMDRDAISEVSAILIKEDFYNENYPQNSDYDLVSYMFKSSKNPFPNANLIKFSSLKGGDVFAK